MCMVVVVVAPVVCVCVCVVVWGGTRHVQRILHGNHVRAIKRNDSYTWRRSVYRCQ